MVYKYNLGDLTRILLPLTYSSAAWHNKDRNLIQGAADMFREKYGQDVLNEYAMGCIIKKYITLPEMSDLFNLHGVNHESIMLFLESLSNYEVPVITGGRIPADVDYWKSYGFLLVGITCDDSIVYERLVKRDGEEVARNSSIKHNTEKDVKHIVENLCDIRIPNNGTIEELNENSKIIWDYIK